MGLALALLVVVGAYSLLRPRKLRAGPAEPLAEGQRLLALRRVEAWLHEDEAGTCRRDGIPPTILPSPPVRSSDAP